MENFIIYIAKASLLTAVFFLAYHFLLRKETFFNGNRWFLLAGLFTAIILPAIAYTKIVWVDPHPSPAEGNLDLAHYVAIQDALRSVKGQPAPDPVNWFDVAAGLYFAGVLFFFARFMYDIISLRKLLNKQQIVKLGSYYMVDTTAVQHPFSFFNYIVYNSSVLEPHELESIISHEKVHSSQRHSLDMVLSQLFCIAFWFNPLAWKYKKSISQNLEFIADAVATRQIADARLYQKTMLKFTVQPEYIAITNHFYQSLIKKRIVMLNKQKSRKMNSLKYGLVLPVLAAFMLLFQIKTVAQEKKTYGNVVESKVKVSVEINKDSKDAELEEKTKIFKEEFDTDVDFQNVERNAKSEITGVKVTVKDKSQSQVYQVAGTEPIRPFTIEVEKDDKGKKSFAFGNSNKNRMIRANNFKVYGDVHKGDTVVADRKMIIRDNGAMSNMPAPPTPPNFPRPEPFEGHWSVNSLKFGDTDALIVINGVKQKKGSEIKLPLDQEITELNVLKDKEAKKKYGKEGKHGVVEITTGKTRGMRMGRLGNGNGHAYAITIPEGDMDFDFDFDMEGFGDMDVIRLNGLEDMQRMFDDMGANFQFSADMSEEDMAEVMKKVKEAQEKIRSAAPKIKRDMKNDLSEQEYKEALEEAKKGMEEARKEMEKARKDLENTRRQLNKKA
ncbi:MAG: M56 family metallopeptidase [Flavobacterium sp.]